MLRRKTAFLLTAAVLVTFALTAPAGCSDGGATAAGGGASSSQSTTTGPSSTATTSGGGMSSSSGSGGGSVSLGNCPTTFTWKSAGPTQRPRVAGEWQGFDLASATV